jgi:outer membrane protein TolC
VNLQREQVLPLLDRNSKLFRAALDARELNIVDFVTVQQRALQTRRAYLQTLVEYRTAVIELDGATGMTLTGLRAALPLPAPPTTQSSTVQPKEKP